MIKNKEAESFLMYLNDMGQESYKTVHTALEAIGSGDELGTAAFRSDDFLGKVLDKFGWLLKYQPPNTKNKDKTLFGKAAWNELLKTATKKQMDQSLKPSDLDLLETFSYLEGDEKKLELATLSEAMAAAVQGTAKKKKGQEEHHTEQQQLYQGQGQRCRTLQR